MTPNERKPGWQSNEIAYAKVRFYGEQDGVRETRLKEELSEFFRSDWRVKAAYLAKMRVGENPPKGYALCLVVAYGCYRNPEIMTRIGQIYAGLFGKYEEMSVVFTEEHEEAELQTVCPPFYNKAGRDADLVRDGLPLTGIVCPHCASGSRPILLAQRTSPHEKGDSGWQFYCKSGAEENIAEAKVLPLKEIVKLEPSLRDWLETPIGMHLWRPMGRSRWEQIKEEKLKGYGLNGHNGHGTNGNGQNGHHSNGQNGHGQNGHAQLGNGMYSPNGEVNFVRETGMPFDRGMTPAEEPAEAKPEDDDPVREYIKLRAGWPHPVEIALYYECFGCGEVLSSGSEGKCRCGNIVISSGVVKIENLTKASAFRQR